MSTLFINGSPNTDGNTAQLAAADFTMHRYADMCGMQYMGMITNASEAERARH